MNNIQPDKLATQPWTKEEVDFIMADMQWKAQDFELRLKSPYLMLLYYPTESDILLHPDPHMEP
ncbi:MAG: hypothetical protein ACLQED_00165 [Desulfobaccales bacterium]